MSFRFVRNLLFSQNLKLFVAVVLHHTPPMRPPAPSLMTSSGRLEHSKLTYSDKAMTLLSWFLLVFTFPISLIFCLKIVNEYKRMVVFRLGKILNSQPLGPGIVLLLPFIDESYTVDLRTLSYDVPPQELLTRDSVTVSVDAAVYYRTSDPIASLAAVSDAHHSTRQLAQSTLRNVLGIRSLEQIMSDREGIAVQAKAILDNATTLWGIHVERVEIKDIRLPRELCRAMAAEAEAARESDAKIVCAIGEKNASFALRKAADELADCPTAMQLRYIHSLAKISAHNNHTIVMPIPMDLVRNTISKIKRK